MTYRLFLWFYDWLATLLQPLVRLYLWRRAKRDPRYCAHLAERFGRYDGARIADAVWVHAVSLGEFRSAVPLVRGLLASGERVLITHFTPAGRSESERVFGDEIARGQVQVIWVPWETRRAYRRFFREFDPKYGLVMEIEIWPRMARACRDAGVPLFMCNAQYPSKSMARDAGGLALRHHAMRDFAGALVKSDLQAARFASVGVRNIHVTGELRFDQPIPQALRDAAGPARRHLKADTRRVITIASAITGEDDTYIAAIKALQAHHEIAHLPKPLIVYVPRAPERFSEVGEILRAAGFDVLARSEVFDDGLDAPNPVPRCPDILLGDSMGEMYFYLAMADDVIVGGGFNPKGAHNIIEPLALGKPVLVGPHVGTIEYPFVEAEAAGVARSVPDAEALADALIATARPTDDMIRAFFADHAGATEKTLAAIAVALAEAR